MTTLSASWQLYLLEEMLVLLLLFALQLQGSTSRDNLVKF